MIKQKRSMFQMIFGEKKEKEKLETYTRFQQLNGFNPIFTNFSGNAYESDVVRSAVDAIARNAAKLKGKHIRRVNGKIVAASSYLDRLLQVRPNPFMDAYSFFYKVVTQLQMRNNAFIFVDVDRFNGIVKGFYPIHFSSLEFLESGGNIYAKFHFFGGKNVVLPYADIIHLRRFFFENDLYGEPSERALNPTLELIHTTDQGIMNAVKSSAFLRGLLKFTTTIKPEDIKKQRDMFVKDYLDISNNGGVAATDSKSDYIELKTDPKMTDEKQMRIILDKVYAYFGVNENIIKSKYTEDEWNSFYSSVIEPIALQMSNEFTSKIFTERELGFGNEIIFSASRLVYASNTSKITMAKELVPLGLFTINEMREIFELEPVEGGDKRIQTLNVVDADKANEYQLAEVS